MLKTLRTCYKLSLGWLLHIRFLPFLTLKLFVVIFGVIMRPFGCLTSLLVVLLFLGLYLFQKVPPCVML
jgi:hypothetical protein